jgi:hypothetical protein
MVHFASIPCPLGSKMLAPLISGQYKRLHPQIGTTTIAYVDNVVAKTRHASTLIDDLRETFKNLCGYNIKLNPENAS